jgi:hypothetical protein
MRNKIKYTVVFHYNTYNSTWYCIPRDLYNRYFNTPIKEKRKMFGVGLTTNQAYHNYLTKTKIK